MPRVDRYRFGRFTTPLWVMEAALVLRGLLFLGTRYTCPCCGWRVRCFTKGNGLLKSRPLSYCPRCNSKARHRRIWLFLEENTNLFTNELKVFEVSPKYSFSRKFVRMPNLQYVAGDIRDRPHLSLRMDLVNTPLGSESFDAALCIHVLEDIVDDRSAMVELYRILKPGAWALIAVPTRMDQLTFEDPSIIEPKERKRAFGEPEHVRVYGHDLVGRLETSGFEVRVELEEAVPAHVREKYGLRGDENIFYCTKPEV